MKKEQPVPRKGSRTLKDVPETTRQQLNQGHLETANLMEALSIDFPVLLKNTLGHSFGGNDLTSFQNLGITQKMKEMGRFLLQKNHPIKDIISHPCDTLRGWAAYMIGQSSGLKIEEKLERIAPLADDPHFGVREWAWLSLRHHCVEMPQEMIQLLSPWTKKTENYRRFASEITRPRGVWCAHVPLLKENPHLALPLLSALKEDPSRYVQNSVANWLNDAFKSKQQWVEDLCAQWQKESHTKETSYICKRALRNSGKQRI